jgi:aldehyde dehydrogenase (NAD+)
LTVYNPSDDTLVSDKIQAASEADVDKAVAAAKAAFPAWKATSGEYRSNLMLKLADLIERDAERIAKLESISMGMPVAVAKFAVLSGVACWRYYAGLTDKIPGETFPDNGDGLFRMVYYEPLGVCAGISAWNATQLFHGFKVKWLLSEIFGCLIMAFC